MKKIIASFLTFLTVGTVAACGVAGDKSSLESSSVVSSIVGSSQQSSIQQEEHPYIGTKRAEISPTMSVITMDGEKDDAYIFDGTNSTSTTFPSLSYALSVISFKV